MLDRGFDGRTSAIAYGSRLVLDALGLWPDIAADAEPIREIRIADDESPLFLHYDCRELIPQTRRRDAARLHRREPRSAPRPVRPGPRRCRASP